MVSKTSGVMIIVSSPSGAGKTTLVKLLAEKNGSKFAFVNLYPPSESIGISGKNHLIPYNKFTKKNKIKLINCGYELTDEYQVKGDGHPNNKAHILYADCIYNGVKNLL